MNALAKYASHLYSCDTHRHPAEGPPFGCTCGLDEALAITERIDERDPVDLRHEQMLVATIAAGIYAASDSHYQPVSSVLAAARRFARYIISGESPGA